jgi:hypothetical protein
MLPAAFNQNLGGRQITMKGVTQFIVARKPRESDSAWEFFPKEILSDLILKVQISLAEERSVAARAFEYANMWGSVPVIGLNVNVPQHMMAFRKEIEEFSNEYDYHTFPRAALLNKVAVTALLSREHAELDIKLVGRLLMDLNSDVLQGGVRPIKQKFFRSTDVDRNGNSLSGFRLVQLDGTSDFLDSLSKLPWNYRFKLGMGTITIRSAGRVPPKDNQSSGNRGQRGRGRGGRARGRAAGRSARPNKFPTYAQLVRGQEDDEPMEQDQDGGDQDVRNATFSEQAQKSLLQMSGKQIFQQMGDDIRGDRDAAEGDRRQEDGPPGGNTAQ